MSKTKWLLFIGIIIVIFGGLIWYTRSNTESSSFEGDATRVITEGPIPDHVYGSDDQKVVLIEYADFQCGGCRAISEPLKAFAQEHQDKLTLVFRQFPLTNIHPNALAAATASEAAGLQGSFWEMHDLLFANMDTWSGAPLDQRQDLFATYADQLGLNREQFLADLGSQDITDKINRDRSTGRSNFGVNSTPSFVLNGTVITGQDAVNSERLTGLIEDALREAYPDDFDNEN